MVVKGPTYALSLSGICQMTENPAKSIHEYF